MMLDPSIRIRRCEDVYDPSDDSYLLINSLEVVRDQAVLEVGCGSGIVALHCAKAGAMVTALDINPLAVECTKRNASLNDILVNVVVSDLMQEVRGNFDLIVFNLPYLRGDPGSAKELAWAGGPSGTETLFRFLSQAVPHLQDGGRIVIVTSSEMDQEALRKLLKGFQVNELASLRLFFEELKVLELKVADPALRRPRSYF